MSTLLTFLAGLLIGTVAGLLIFRKNRDKIDAAEAKARGAADLLRK
jgi:LPXTG-motif cell wall-anchored protein